VEEWEETAFDFLRGIGGEDLKLGRRERVCVSVNNKRKGTQQQQVWE
jgi:hypothetical protein